MAGKRREEKNTEKSRILGMRSVRRKRGLRLLPHLVAPSKLEKPEKKQRCNNVHNWEDKVGTVFNIAQTKA